MQYSQIQINTQSSIRIEGTKTAVIPTHYGSIVGKPEDADVFKRLVDPDIHVVIRENHSCGSGRS